MIMDFVRITQEVRQPIRRRLPTTTPEAPILRRATTAVADILPQAVLHQVVLHQAEAVVVAVPLQAAVQVVQEEEVREEQDVEN
jgi:hypothetical protein